MQYELVFSQHLDGSSTNHKDVEIPKTNVRIPTKRNTYQKHDPIAYKQLKGETARRVQFAKEQQELERKKRDEDFRKSLQVLKETEMTLTKRLVIY